MDFWTRLLENNMKQILALELIISLSAFLVGVLLIIFRRRRGTGYNSTIAYAVCLSLGAIFLYVVSRVYQYTFP